MCFNVSPASMTQWCFPQITLSLTDVALECLCTSSCTHQEDYVLVAAEAAKAYAR